VRAIGLRAAHPRAQGRRRQIEVTGDRADRLAVILDQANGLATKLLIELPAWAPTFPVGRDRKVEEFRAGSRFEGLPLASFQFHSVEPMLDNLRKHWLVVALLALACGCAFGGYKVYRFAMAIAWVQAVEYDGQIGTEAFRLYKSGDPRAARQALAAYLRYLEAMAPTSDAWRPGQHPWLDSRGLAFEKMLAAGRLALVEDRLTGTSPARSRWLIAARYAQEAAQADASRAAIELTIKRLDVAPETPDRRTDGVR
jgi:hypothetical protein